MTTDVHLRVLVEPIISMRLYRAGISAIVNFQVASVIIIFTTISRDVIFFYFPLHAIYISRLLISLELKYYHIYMLLSAGEETDRWRGKRKVVSILDSCK